MFTQAEVRKADIDTTQFSKLVAGTGRGQFKPMSKFGRYFETIYAQHKEERTQKNWMEILALIHRLLEFVQDELVNEVGDFKMPWWKMFKVFSFMRNWFRAFLAAVRKKNTDEIAPTLFE